MWVNHSVAVETLLGQRSRKARILERIIYLVLERTIACQELLGALDEE